MKGYDSLNDPPIGAAQWERMRANRPPCPECGRQPWRGHWPWCSKADKAVRERYTERQQRHDYRYAAWEQGCICPKTLGPHTHREDCPLYRSAEEWRDHLDEEHQDDA